MNRFFRILFMIFLFLSAGVFQIGRAEAKMVSVGLSIEKASIKVSSSSSITATDARGKRHPIGTSAVFRSSGKGSASVGSRTFHLPVTLSSGHPLSFNGRRYRGTFRILRGKSGITLVNVLDLEDYLRGVLKMEVNPARHMEVFKAQAVVARTYALRSIQQNNGKNGYDLGDSVLSQVYRGMNAEDKRADEAIRATKGVVVKYSGSVAFTPFHSDSGGATADVSTVWGGTIPYLRGVKEPFPPSSPNSTWEARLSRAQVEKALRQSGADVGSLRALRIGDVDPFGRSNTLTAVGTKGTKHVKSHSFRMAAGSTVIKSTSFSLASPSAGTSPVPLPVPVPRTEKQKQLPAKEVPTSNTPMSASEERQLTALTEQGIFNSEELMDMLMNPEKRKGYLIRALRTTRPVQPSPGPLPAFPSTGGSFVFRGKGWGHGVGLSQWGAKKMAEKGWDYKKIIQHYYPGTTVGSM